MSSQVEVFTRIKILTAEGVSFGTVTLPSSDVWRLRDLEARTVLPDGRVVELDSKTIFTKTNSEDYTRSTVSFVMPEVVPGAIVDFRYRRFFDSLYFPEPWYFEGQLPIQSSRYTCDVPRQYYFETPMSCPSGIVVSRDEQDYVAGTRVTFVAERVPPLPAEPAQPPFADLACRVTFLAEAERARPRDPILSSWRNVITYIRGHQRAGYGLVRGDSNGARALARELAAAQATAQDKAAALFRYVRDNVTSRPPFGISPGELRADDVLKRGEGTMAQKAILLQLMLDAVDISASVGLTASRLNGRVDTEQVNPGQLDSAIVVAEIGGERVFLDPSDQRLGYGSLPARLEGVPCLLLDAKGETWVETPATPASASRRVCSLRLELDADGVLQGAGTLILTGHHAHVAMHLQPSPQLTSTAWQRWLEGRMQAAVVVEEVVEAVEERRVEVRWRMQRRPLTAPADEVSVVVAQPLALGLNPFTLPPEQRRTPVMLGFADSQEVVLDLRWAPGWSLEAEPRLHGAELAVGRLTTSLKVDKDGRRLVTQRELVVGERQFDRSAYPELQKLYREAVSSDAESVVLVAGGSG